MKLYRLAGALVLPMLFSASVIVAQDTAPTEKQLKHDEKANKAQAKADKQQRKAMKAQEKSEKAARKSKDESQKAGTSPS